MSRAQDKRVWLGGGALAAVLIGVVGWFGVISPQLSAASSLRDQSDSARAQNSVLESKIAKLKKQNDNVGKLTASLRAALAALPFDSGLPAFTRQLSSQATKNRIVLTSLTVGSGSVTTGTGVATTPTTGTTATALVAIPVTLASTGSGPNQLAFLRAIQVDGPRRALVTSTQLTPATGTSLDGSSTMTTQITVFSAPLTAQARAQLVKLLSGN